jgi:hypothetical protein
MAFNMRDHYWFVGGDQSQVYSSNRNIYVLSSDQAYIDWGGITSNIASEAELWAYLQSILPAWMYDGTNTFVQPSVGAYTTAQLKSYAEVSRTNKSDGGMVAETIPINTDTFSRTRISNARTAAQADAAYTTTLLGSDGTLYPVNATQIIAISNDVIAFGTNLADTYATVHGDIDAGTITTLQQIDTAFAAVSRSVKDGAKNHFRGG